MWLTVVTNRVPATKLGNHWFIYREDLDRFVPAPRGPKPGWKAQRGCGAVDPARRT